MKTILLCPKGSIGKGDKTKLSKEGYIVVEVADTKDIKTVSDLSLLTPDIIAITAIECMNHANTTVGLMQTFASKIVQKTLAKVNSSTPPAPKTETK